MRYIESTFLFPVCVVRADNATLVTSELVEEAKNLAFKYKDTPYGSCISTVNTFNQVLSLDVFTDIRKEVERCIDYYCKKLHLKKDNLSIFESWINYYDINGYQDLHLHAGSVLSGVFYIQSSGQHDLNFQAPWHFFQPIPVMVTELNSDNSPNMLYESKTGRCYVFPSHLLHQTKPSKSEKISIAFNIKYL